MIRSIALLVACTISMLLTIHGSYAAEGPSGCATGMPGAEGRIEFMPKPWKEGQSTWWKDTDGVDPAAAGCHIETDSEGKAIENGRDFGEACISDVLLVESNPGAFAVHMHLNDTGHPDTFNCLDWCLGTGASGGSCQVADAPPCVASARCVCD